MKKFLLPLLLMSFLASCTQNTQINTSSNAEDSHQNTSSGVYSDQELSTGVAPTISEGSRN